VAKLPAPASALGPAPVSPTPEVKALPRRRSARQGTKQRQREVDIKYLVQSQILGEIEAIQAIEPAMGRGKRVKVSKK
jgi:hypothetical protein